MGGAPKSSKSKQCLLNYKWVPRDITYFDVVEIIGEEDKPRTSDLQGKDHEFQSSGKPFDQTISTKKLVSSISYFWETISQPLSALQSKNVRNNRYGEVTHPSSLDKFLLEACASGSDLERHKNAIGSKTSSSPYKIVSPYPNVTLAHNFLTKTRRNGHNMLSTASYGCGGHFVYSKIIADSPLLVQPSTNYGLTTPGFSCDLIRMYGYVSNFPIFGSKNLIVDTLVKREEQHPENNKTTCEATGGKPGINQEYLCSVRSMVQHSTTSGSTTSKSSPPCEAYFVDEKEKTDRFSIVDFTRRCLLSECHVNISQWRGKSLCQSFQTIVDYSCVSPHWKRNNTAKNVERFNDTSKLLSLSPCKRNNFFPASERHAFAGAMAGIFVSLWLHPVDTIKTVTQSCSMDQTSIPHVVRKIISERGLTGLYRGLGSNILSSAPISAVYTFTYESVKGVLLPLLAKVLRRKWSLKLILYESTILLPIAQQVVVQVLQLHLFLLLVNILSSRCKLLHITKTADVLGLLGVISSITLVSMLLDHKYSLVGVIKKGGLSSLYAGWGAVLCRNIPHSIIKFYTYETLKNWALSSKENCLHLSTLQTLIFGGIAGSTAALFTTPFDVVKTRLQTQIPGSVKVYDGVFHTLREIATREGFKGLYRGLTPRLVIYMTQGALFFASYEFFKRLLSLDIQDVDGQDSITQVNQGEGCSILKEEA